MFVTRAVNVKLGQASGFEEVICGSPNRLALLVVCGSLHVPVRSVLRSTESITLVLRYVQLTYYIVCRSARCLITPQLKINSVTKTGFEKNVHVYGYNINIYLFMRI